MRAFNLNVRETENMSVDVIVRPADEYSGLHEVRFVTQVYDEYTKKQLEPRSHRLLLTTVELTSLAAQLTRAAESFQTAELIK